MRHHSLKRHGFVVSVHQRVDLVDGKQQVHVDVNNECRFALDSSRVSMLHVRHGQVVLDELAFAFHADVLYVEVKSAAVQVGRVFVRLQVNVVARLKCHPFRDVHVALKQQVQLAAKRISFSEYDAASMSHVSFRVVNQVEYQTERKVLEHVVVLKVRRQRQVVFVQSV